MVSPRHTAKSANINANGGVTIRPYKTRFILEILKILRILVQTKKTNSAKFFIFSDFFPGDKRLIDKSMERNSAFFECSDA